MQSLLLMLCLPLAAGAEPIAVTDERGVELRFAAPPRRIVSLLPSSTESVCVLGACARLVGTDRYSNWPPEVAALPKLGGLEDAQIERIVALRPEVVLAAPSARAVERLEALGLKVLVMEPRDHAGVRRSLELLAQLLGRPQDAAAVWRRIEREIDTAAARVPPSQRGRTVYFEIDATPYAAGASSFIGETLARLGLGNIVPPALGPFPKLNPEFVVRSQPSLVMAAPRNLAEMAARPGWSALHALRDGQVCAFDSAPYDLLSRPGPRLGEAAAVLADCVAGLAGARP